MYSITFVIYRLKKYLLFQNLQILSSLEFTKFPFFADYAKKINIYYEPFHHITVQPNTDIFSYLSILSIFMHKLTRNAQYSIDTNQ